MSDNTIAADARKVQDQGGYWTHIVLTVVLLSWLAILVIYRDTFAAMVRVWWTSDTFSHGFLIAPIATWLIWRQRAAFSDSRAAPSFAFALVVVVAAALWSISAITSINATMQLAAVAMLVFAPLAIIGWQAGRVLLFPLAFLFFAVPLGEALVPLLMDFTGRFAVAALRATGVPVFKEGFLISTASGEFEVAKACSGIRYLLATLAVGSVFAYLAIRGPWKRLAFVALCLVVPIVANGIRAYGIILLASLASIDQAVDVDHLVYGWLFFGVVLLLLFLLGRHLADDAPRESPPTAARAVNAGTAPHWLFAASAAGLIVILAVAQSIPAVIVDRLEQSASIRKLQPRLAGAWQGPMVASSAWRPSYEGADQLLLASYTDGVRTMDTALVFYASQSQGHELVNARNEPYDSPRWMRVDEGLQKLSTQALGSVVLRQTYIRSRSVNRVVWSAYIVDGAVTHSGVDVKFDHVVDRLLGRQSRSMAVLVSMEVEHLSRDVERELQRFIEDFLPAVIACVERGDAASTECVE